MLGAGMSWDEFLILHAMELALMAMLLLVSAFFSASETALFSLSRSQRHHLSHGSRLDRLAGSLLARPQRTLNTILLGNMLANTAYAAVSAVLVLGLPKLGLASWQTACMSFLPLLILILLAEITPKSIALLAGVRLAAIVASPVAILSKILHLPLWLMDQLFVRPLTRIVSPREAIAGNITADELAAMLDLSAKRGVINLETNTLLQEIVELTDLRARDIMVPRVDIIACEATAPSDELAGKFRSSHLRRLPVYEGDMDHMLGVVHAKRFLLNPKAPLRSLVVKVPFVPEAANVERVLLQFRVTRSQIAFVVDEYGGIAGLVTLEDVLEEIVGDIPDPRQPARPMVELINPHEYWIDGELGIHEWADAFRTDLGGHRISTIGGFVMSLLGHLPKAGDSVQYRNLKFTVESVHKRRIEKLHLELLEGRP
jgi:putative hemolysin